MNKIRLNTKIKIDENDLAESIMDHFISFDDEDFDGMADFALKLCQNSDLTYEMHLLKKICKMIKDMYGDVTANEDELMFEIVKKIDDLIPLIDQID